MRRLSILGLLLMPLAAAHAQTPPSSTTLAQLRGRFRPLLLFAPTPDDPSLLAQMTRLKDAAPGLHERDVLVIAIPFRNPSPTEVSLTTSDAEAARRRFGIAPTDFTAILIGKDGGEKLRSPKPLSFAKLRDTIDAMPMRQQEQQQQQHHKSDQSR